MPDAPLPHQFFYFFYVFLSSPINHIKSLPSSLLLTIRCIFKNCRWYLFSSHNISHPIFSSSSGLRWKTFCFLLLQFEPLLYSHSISTVSSPSFSQAMLYIRIKALSTPISFHFILQLNSLYAWFNFHFASPARC